MQTLLFAAISAATNIVAELPPVVVYASRTEDSREIIPADVTVFTADEIAASGARDLPELLSKKANIDVRRLNANPLNTQIAMRGFGENSFGRVKIVADGEELNNVDMEVPNLARIPIGSIERVEVVHGPSPVLYGDGAVAGVVNIITDTHDYERKTRVTGTAGSQNTFGANIQTKGGFEEEGIQYSAAYDYLTSDGYRNRSAYEMHTVNAAIRKNFANGSTIGIKSHYYNAFYEMPGSLDYDGWKHGRKDSTFPNDWCRTWSYGFGFDSKARIVEDQWLYLDGSFSQRYRRANFDTYGYANEYDLYALSLSPRYVNEMDIADFGNKLTVGLDFRYDRDDIKNGSPYYPPHPHFDRMRYAAFIHEEFFILDNLSIVAGARLENIRNRWAKYRNLYTSLAENHGHDWMGDYELGLVYRPIDGLKTYIRGTRFHRSAFCDELNYTQDKRFLNPERGTSLDIGFEYAFLDEFTVDFNGYGTIMEDEIFYNPYAAPSPYGGWSGYNCNSPSKTRRIGFDTGLAWKRDKVAEASVKYGFVHADFGRGQYHGDDVPLVPNSRIRAEVGVWVLDDLEIKGGYRFIGKQKLAGDFGNDHEGLPSASLFDIGAYYNPSWCEGLRIAFVMDNLLNRNYCDFAGWSDYSGGYYYPACGRSFMFTVSYEF